jgi:MoaA/NifB/PqqE/SkfB family radical SAM enzyme
MKFTSFTFMVTEDCNFNCSYCYQDKKKRHIDISILKRAIDFFFPFFTDGCSVNFYGGEPLLAFELIQQAVAYIQQKSRGLDKGIKFSMTSNGSLIDDHVLQFLQKNRFSLLLSFDGLAQEVSRKKGSFGQIVSVIEMILNKRGIDFEINSVFTPKTIGYLSRSIQFVAELGVPNIGISLSKITAWDTGSLDLLRSELKSTRGFLLSFYESTRNIPLANFRGNSQKGIFVCTAGLDRMALTPGGKLWGCHLFFDCFKGKKVKEEYAHFCFGDLESFIEDHESIYPEILSHYSQLRMDLFYTPSTFCILCDEIMECHECPMVNKLSGSKIWGIPSWTCEINKIFRREKKLFLNRMRGSE